MLSEERKGELLGRAIVSYVMYSDVRDLLQGGDETDEELDELFAMEDFSGLVEKGGDLLMGEAAVQVAKKLLEESRE